MLVVQTALFLQVLHMPSDSKARNIMEKLKEKLAELWNKVNVQAERNKKKKGIKINSETFLWPQREVLTKPCIWDCTYWLL